MRAPFSIPKRFHLIGIGGIGMSALARILLERNLFVQGSDSGSSSILDELEKKGATIFRTQSARHIKKGDVVVYSSAITPNNVELQAAEAMGCQMMHRSQLLSELMQEHKSVAIAGTHGKTTTSSMLTAIFLEAKMNPSYALGGLLCGKNGEAGKGGHFLFEADESDGSLINYHPHCAIVTNIEAEHLDHFKQESALFEAFDIFADQVKDYLLYCGDQMRLKRGFSYGFCAGVNHRLSHFKQEGWKITFDLDDIKEIEVAATGRHNALNAAAAFLMARHLKIPEAAIRSALRGFSGVKRRCERRGEQMAVLRIDDYAHHPTEIKAALRGIKEAVGERRLVVLFQPHRYSRTQDHLLEFAHAFEWADKVYITDIFQAREEPIPGLSAHTLIEVVKHKDCTYVSREECSGIELRPHDVFVTMGAGDITKVETPQNVKKWKVTVLAGGKSPEHEISLRSAQFVFDSLNPELYEKQLMTIPRSGKWDLEQIERVMQSEVVLPVLHGPNGEDGTIQGFLKTLDIPFMGADHVACGIAMNKALTKQLVEQVGVPTPPYKSFLKEQWIGDRQSCLQHNLRYPLYVKAVHLGSSIGTYLIKKESELEAAIEKAFGYDHEVMLEEGKVACREIEFAALGNLTVKVPNPGEKLAQGKFVDYEMKYGKNPVPTSIDPTIPKKTLQEGKEWARKVFQVLRMSGLARIDFLLDRDNHWWFFEINPIPGMQKLSLFPKIWNREGLSAEKLADQLVIMALARARL